MSGSATIGTEQGILQHTLGISAMAFPAQVYVALCAAGLPPSETIGGVEAFGGGYSRVAATFALLASPTNIAANSQSVEFPLATAAWGSLGYFEIWSALTGGSRLYWGGLVDPVSGAPTTLNVAAGDIVRFSAGTLTIQAVPFTPTVSAGVSSFNTRTGAVILSNSDVVGVLPPSANPPLMDGVAAVGTSAAWARGDHVHPSDAGIAANAAAAGHNIGRNFLHNPLFRVTQRGTAVVSTSGGYPADRWMANANLDTLGFQVFAFNDAARAQIGDEAATFALGNTFTGNAGAAAVSYLEQRIEAVRRLSGKTVTVSFWAASSGTLKLGINLTQVFGTGGSPSGPVTALTTGASITTTGTYARYLVSVAIPSATGMTLGTNSNDYTALRFFYSSGATSNAQAGNIGVQSGTINIWGCQLEIGSVATPLEKPDPRYDTSNCQRFFSAGSFWLAGCGVAASIFGYSVPFMVPMHHTPTVAANFTSLTNATAASQAANGNSGVILSATATATTQTLIAGTFSASADL